MASKKETSVNREWVNSFITKMEELHELFDETPDELDEEDFFKSTVGETNDIMTRLAKLDKYQPEYTHWIAEELRRIAHYRFRERSF